MFELKIFYNDKSSIEFQISTRKKNALFYFGLKSALRLLKVGQIIIQGKRGKTIIAYDFLMWVNHSVFNFFNIEGVRRKIIWLYYSD
jgi:hypothetical protein